MKDLIDTIITTVLVIGIIITGFLAGGLIIVAFVIAAIVGVFLIVTTERPVVTVALIVALLGWHYMPLIEKMFLT